jgi:hypothetical protein
MVAEGSQALLSAPRRDSTHLVCPWTLEPAWMISEGWVHPRSLVPGTARLSLQRVRLLHPDSLQGEQSLVSPPP